MLVAMGGWVAVGGQLWALYARRCVCVCVSALWWMPAVRHHPKVMVVAPCSVAMVTNMPRGGMRSCGAMASAARAPLAATPQGPAVAVLTTFDAPPQPLSHAGHCNNTARA